MPTNTPDTAGVLAEVIEIVSAETGVNAADISSQTSFDQLGCDSLHSLKLVMKLEEHFDIEFSDAEGDPLTTIEALAQLVTNKIAERQPDMTPSGSFFTILLGYLIAAGRWFKWSIH